MKKREEEPGVIDPLVGIERTTRGHLDKILDPERVHVAAPTGFADSGLAVRPNDLEGTVWVPPLASRRVEAADEVDRGVALVGEGDRDLGSFTQFASRVALDGAAYRFPLR